MDLLVSYNWGQFSRARHEIIRILKHFGDPDPWVEKTFVMGIALVHSCLDNREVIKRCRALWESEPLNSFEFAIKWVPVDYWCATDLTLSLIHISEPTRRRDSSRMPSSA